MQTGMKSRHASACSCSTPDEIATEAGTLRKVEGETETLCGGLDHEGAMIAEHARTKISSLHCRDTVK
jgi:hypothetical protein